MAATPGFTEDTVEQVVTAACNQFSSGHISKFAGARKMIAKIMYRLLLAPGRTIFSSGWMPGLASASYMAPDDSIAKKTGGELCGVGNMDPRGTP